MGDEMTAVDLLCLANSYKLGGRCVAGLRLDTLEWVRPVSATEHGELATAACRLDAGRQPQPLDVIRVDLTKAAPKRHQPENWLVSGATWGLVGTLSVEEAARSLDRAVIEGPHLLGNTQDSVDWDLIEAHGVAASLSLVRVEPRFYVNPWNKLRGTFNLCGTTYDLAVTDSGQWTADARNGRAAAGTDWYLTASLGENYKTKNRAYKLIAAGIPTASG